MRSLFFLTSLFVSLFFVVPSFAESKLTVYDNIGGDFSAQSSSGKPVQLSDFKDKVKLVYFGYSSCPHICPMMTAEIAGFLKKLGAKSDKVQAVLVSVDTQTETPQKLKRFIDKFDPRIVGITDKEPVIQRIAALYKVGYSIEPMPMDHSGQGKADKKATAKNSKNKHAAPKEAGAPNISHGTQIFLVDQNNKVRKVFYPNFNQEEIAADLSSLGI